MSPHASGLTQASDVPGVFLSNYERFVRGENLHYTVDWKKGYYTVDWKKGYSSSYVFLHVVFVD